MSEDGDGVNLKYASLWLDANRTSLNVGVTFPSEHVSGKLSPVGSKVTRKVPSPWQFTAVASVLPARMPPLRGYSALPLRAAAETSTGTPSSARLGGLVTEAVCCGACDVSEGVGFGSVVLTFPVVADAVGCAAGEE
jgi:hypothetical protein